MYKAVIALYLICFSSYLLFSRVPDYFDGDFIHGVVQKATFSYENKEPQLEIDYRVGSNAYHYKTNTWFLKSYKPGERVTIIYNPSSPEIASIYAFIGYWINWSELLFTAGFFLLLFFVAKGITGTHSTEPLSPQELAKKRKYKD